MPVENVFINIDPLRDTHEDMSGGIIRIVKVLQAYYEANCNFLTLPKTVYYLGETVDWIVKIQETLSNYGLTTVDLAYLNAACAGFGAKQTATIFGLSARTVRNCWSENNLRLQNFSSNKHPDHPTLTAIQGKLIHPRILNILTMKTGLIVANSTEDQKAYIDAVVAINREPSTNTNDNNGASSRIRSFRNHARQFYNEFGLANMAECLTVGFLWQMQAQGMNGDSPSF